MSTNACRSGRIDAILWFAIPCALLMIVPIGFASNDGVGHSIAFANGRWELNPNHLLFEPLGAWWQHTMMAIGYPRAPFDALKLLSILSGSIAVALFRLCIAPRLAPDRLASNHATAWMAFSSAFLRLWISDETHMIQMPAVTAMLWLALLSLERRSFARSFLLGVATGVAALMFISNVLIGAALAGVLVIWQLRRRELVAGLSVAASIAAGFLVTAAPPLILAWSETRRAVTFFEWMTRYGGGLPSRIRDSYGVDGGLSGLLASSVRALYGGACAIVDITGFGAAMRDSTRPGLFACAAMLVLLAAAVVLFHAFRIAIRRRVEDEPGDLLLVVIPATLAVMLFGVFWNNSDDQFYFQLAPIAGMLACLLPIRRVDRRWTGIALLSGLVLIWNGSDVFAHRVLYPREQRVAMLEHEVGGACLIVTPGFDEAELLLEISPRPMPRVSIAVLASTFPYETGIGELSSRIDRCLSSGGQVAFVDIFDTPRDRPPWKYLRRLGYERSAVERTISRFPIDESSRRVGSFTVRWARTRKGLIAVRPGGGG